MIMEKRKESLIFIQRAIGNEKKTNKLSFTEDL